MQNNPWLSPIESFTRIVNHLKTIYMQKNQDYGNSFEDSMEEHGAIAFIVRADDKMRRAKQLQRNPEDRAVSDESFMDTIRDLANYCIMYLMWHERVNWQKKIYENTEHNGVTPPKGYPPLADIDPKAFTEAHKGPVCSMRGTIKSDGPELFEPAPAPCGFSPHDPRQDDPIQGTHPSDDLIRDTQGQS